MRRKSAVRGVGSWLTRGLAGAAMSVAVPLMAAAQDAPPNPPPATPPPTEGHYTFLPSGEGFVRLDNRNGEVALCSRRAVGWACEMLPDERAALETEIARLQRQNARLKSDLLAHGLALPGQGTTPGTAPKTPPESGGTRPKFPDETDLARLKTALAQAWQRLVDLVARLAAEADKKD